MQQRDREEFTEQEASEYLPPSTLGKLGKVLRPFLILSLIFHAFILLIPLSNREEPEPEKAVTEDRVTLTPIQRPKPSPSPSSSPTPTASPSVTPTPKAASTPQPKVPQSVPKRSPQPQPPPQSPSPQPPTPVVSPSPIELSPSPSPSPSLSPSPSPTSYEPVLPTSPFASANFPLYQGAQSGCFGSTNCNQVSGVQGFRNLSGNLQQHLEQNGYQVERRDDLEETGVAIFEVSKGGETQYLSVLDSGTLGTAIYVLVPTPIASLEELEKLENARLEITQFLDGIANSQAIADSSYFAQPGFFFLDSQPRSEIGASFRWVRGGQPPFTDTLVAQGFEVESSGSYGGGELYALKRDRAIIGYLNFVPTSNHLAPEAQGTIVVFWQSHPGS